MFLWSWQWYRFICDVYKGFLDGNKPVFRVEVVVESTFLKDVKSSFDKMDEKMQKALVSLKICVE